MKLERDDESGITSGSCVDGYWQWDWRLLRKVSKEIVDKSLRGRQSLAAAPTACEQRIEDKRTSQISVREARKMHAQAVLLADLPVYHQREEELIA